MFITDSFNLWKKNMKVNFHSTCSRKKYLVYINTNICMVVSKHRHNIVIVQSLSCVWLFATLWTIARQAPLSSTVSRSLLKFMSTKLVMLSNHLVLCCPLLLLHSVFPSITVFSTESALHIRWPNFWSFSVSPSNEYSGLISFRIDWFDLFAVQETLKSIPYHHNLKHQFFGTQPSWWSSSHICT